MVIFLVPKNESNSCNVLGQPAQGEWRLSLMEKLSEMRAFLEDAVDQLHLDGETIAAEHIEAAREELALAMLSLGRR